MSSVWPVTTLPPPPPPPKKSKDDRGRKDDRGKDDGGNASANANANANAHPNAKETMTAKEVYPHQHRHQNQLSTAPSSPSTATVKLLEGLHCSCVGGSDYYRAITGVGGPRRGEVGGEGNRERRQPLAALPPPASSPPVREERRRRREERPHREEPTHEESVEIEHDRQREEEGGADGRDFCAGVTTPPATAGDGDGEDSVGPSSRRRQQLRVVTRLHSGATHEERMPASARGGESERGREGGLHRRSLSDEHGATECLLSARRKSIVTGGRTGPAARTTRVLELVRNHASRGNRLHRRKSSGESASTGSGSPLLSVGKSLSAAASRRGRREKSPAAAAAAATKENVVLSTAVVRRGCRQPPPPPPPPPPRRPSSRALRCAASEPDPIGGVGGAGCCTTPPRPCTRRVLSAPSPGCCCGASSAAAPSSPLGGGPAATLAHSSTLPRVEEGEFADWASSGRPPGGRGPGPPSSSSWTPTDGTSFSLRVGPDYARRGRKAPSLRGLYETVAVRCYRSRRRTRGGVSAVLPLPIQAAFGDSGGDGAVEIGEISDPTVPEVLVVHFPVPFEEPSVFRSKDDGVGGEIVLYLRPSRRFVDELNGAVPATPATNLFVRWCGACEADASTRSRFKVMGVVRDPEGLGSSLGSWIGPYNGRPVLITESGSVTRGTQSGVRYLEMAANVHAWGYLAKKGLVSLVPRLKDLRIDFGFTIEAWEDDEMPECILGSACMNHVDPHSLPEMEPSLQANAT